MAKNPQVQFTLTVKDNKYKGKTFTQLVGSFEDGRNSFLVSIQTDSNGIPKIYKSEKGAEFIYARCVKFAKSENGQRKRKNQF